MGNWACAHIPRCECCVGVGRTQTWCQEHRHARPSCERLAQPAATLPIARATPLARPAGAPTHPRRAHMHLQHGRLDLGHGQQLKKLRRLKVADACQEREGAAGGCVLVRMMSTPETLNPSRARPQLMALNAAQLAAGCGRDRVRRARGEGRAHWCAAAVSPWGGVCLGGMRWRRTYGARPALRIHGLHFPPRLLPRRLGGCTGRGA